MVGRVTKRFAFCTLCDVFDFRTVRHGTNICMALKCMFLVVLGLGVSASDMCFCKVYPRFKKNPM